MAKLNADVANPALAAEGKKKILWSDRDMPVLALIRERFEKKRPLKGLRLGCCMHVTSETANLMRTLKAGGAQVALCASNPLSTQDHTAASLVCDFGIPVFARRGESVQVFYDHLNAVIDTKPHITMDDGADLVNTLHTQAPGRRRQHPRQHGRNDHRRHPPARDGGRRHPQIPGCRG